MSNVQIPDRLITARKLDNSQTFSVLYLELRIKCVLPSKYWDVQGPLFDRQIKTSHHGSKTVQKSTMCRDLWRDLAISWPFILDVLATFNIMLKQLGLFSNKCMYNVHYELCPKNQNNKSSLKMTMKSQVLDPDLPGDSPINPPCRHRLCQKSHTMHYTQ